MDVSWKTGGSVVAMVVVVGFLVVAVVVLAADAGAVVVSLGVLVAGLQGIGFELGGAEDLAPRKIRHCSADSDLDCGADLDCYCTDSMASGGTDATSC